MKERFVRDTGRAARREKRTKGGGAGKTKAKRIQYITKTNKG